MASTRKSTPTKIRTAAGHTQTYHVATGPEPREAVTPLAKTEPVTLAPALADAEFDPITGLNAEGWTRDGLDRDGYAQFRKPLDDYGYTPLGFTFDNFDHDGNHRDTGTQFNPEGRDRHGFGADGLVHSEDDPTPGRYNEYGFSADGIHRGTRLPWDKRDFDWDGQHRDTRTPYNPDGYGRAGFDPRLMTRTADGLDRRDFDNDGRDQKGNHYTTGGPLDSRGFAADGVNALTGTTLDSEGWDAHSRTKEGDKLMNGRARLASRGRQGPDTPWTLGTWVRKNISA